MASDTTEVDEQGRDAPVFDQALTLVVARVATLARVQLLSCFFTRHDDGPLPTWDGVFDHDDVTFGMTGRFDVDRVASPAELGCFLTFSAEFDSEEEEPTEPPGPFFVGAAYRVIYSLGSLDDVTDAALETFAYWNGLLTLWPYWRELAGSLGMRAGIDLTVPIFRLPAS